MTVFYLWGDTVLAPYKSEPFLDKASIPQHCQEYRCTLRLVSRNPSTVEHRTGEGHEHTFAIPPELFDDIDTDIWDYVKRNVDDIHGSMGMEAE